MVVFACKVNFKRVPIYYFIAGHVFYCLLSIQSSPLLPLVRMFPSSSSWWHLTTVLLLLSRGVSRTSGSNAHQGPAISSSRVIIAVNAGGLAYRDVFGINYSSDKDNDVGGTESDYGRRFDIGRCHPEDAFLYQTERYSTEESFAYQVPLKKDGEYVLVLKFSEVYFRGQGEKVFDVLLGDAMILSNLDIFREVGFATAHDEIVPFMVKNKGQTLAVHDVEVPVKNGKVDLTFQRGTADNPKINAFYVIQGTINDVPKLPPIIPRGGETEESIFEDEDDEEIEINEGDLGNDETRNLKTFSTGTNKWIRSGPVHMDPWDMQTSLEKYLPLGTTLFSFAISVGFLFKFIKIGGGRNVGVGK